MPGPATVIAGHDGTHRGFDAIVHAQQVAAARDARVVVVHVIERQMPFTSRDPTYQHQQRDRVGAVFAPVREMFGQEIETRLVAAVSPAAGLRQSAEDERAVAVVVGPSHHGPVGHVLYGDVAHWLTRHCDCAVEVAPVGEHTELEARSPAG
jgi:nucleotide-binding universal stress UspA family protein